MKLALINAAMVGSGGFLGALARYGLGGLVQRQVPGTTFPYGTLVVNLLGCLLIGLFAGLAESRQLLTPELRLFGLVGVLGGFTTFSTFGHETFTMVRDGLYLSAATNVGLQVVLGTRFDGLADPLLSQNPISARSGADKSNSSTFMNPSTGRARMSDGSAPMR